MLTKFPTVCRNSATNVQRTSAMFHYCPQTLCFVLLFSFFLHLGSCIFLHNGWISALEVWCFGCISSMKTTSGHDMKLILHYSEQVRQLFSQFVSSYTTVSVSLHDWILPHVQDKGKRNNHQKFIWVQFAFVCSFCKLTFYILKSFCCFCVTAWQGVYDIVNIQ